MRYVMFPCVITEGKLVQSREYVMALINDTIGKISVCSDEISSEALNESIMYLIACKNAIAEIERVEAEEAANDLEKNT